jgi:acyl-coenzyme A synthetase/AMP-(fatty) acid ligase
MSPRSFLACFLGHVANQPEATALVWHGERISYADLHAMAGQSAANHLGGLSKLQPVGVVAEKSPAAIAMILGCLMAGRCPVLPAAQLASEVHRALFERAGCAAALIQTVDADCYSTGFERRKLEHASATQETAAIDAAIMLTTSGSTGQPKLVPLTMAAIDRFTDWAGEHFGMRPGSVVLNYAPLNFDLCFLDIWAALKAGGSVVLVDPRQATNGGYLLDLLARWQVEVVQAVPMLYALLLDASNKTVALPNVRHAIFTGDSMSPACLDLLPNLFPSARFYNIYGCTETNDSFIYNVDLLGRNDGVMPIGAPLPGVKYLIVDETEQPIPEAGVGELLVSTPFQTRGYVGSATNQEKFVDLHSDAARTTYFRSGDLVRRHADGTITLEGRKDFHVKVRGVQVNVQHVEQALLAHPAIAEAAVVAIPDPLAGHRLHACLRRRSETRLNSLVLFQHCATMLARAAIPSAFRVGETALPRTSTGKIDRQHIRQLIMNGEQNVQ